MSSENEDRLSEPLSSLDHSRMVELTTVADAFDAGWLLSALRQEGIPSTAEGLNFGAAFPGYLGARGARGLRVWVAQDALESAQEVLADWQPLVRPPEVITTDRWGRAVRDLGMLSLFMVLLPALALMAPVFLVVLIYTLRLARRQEPEDPRKFRRNIRLGSLLGGAGLAIFLLFSVMV